MPNIDTSKIPEHVGNELARYLLRTVALYFEDPEHRKAFEEWKAARDAKEAEQNAEK